MSSEAVVHVIDDDEAVRDSLTFLLRSARMTVRSYDSATAFLDALPGIAPGCVVTDVRMPDVSGIDLLRRLRERGITMPVIVMTGHGDVPLAVEAMKIGAADFFEKPFEDDALLAAIQAALGNLDKTARGEAERAELHERLALLTNREREVLQGLVAGNPNKIIAYDLGISPRTVEIYRANVMTKMKAASLSELVRMALQAGLLTGDKT
jgi:two-component system response regulator FixJ